MEQKMDEICLSKDDSFIIRINYVIDANNIGEYDKVKVTKIKNGNICKEHLSGTSAAVLKCAYDYSKGKHKGVYIFHTSDAELPWPFYREVRPRNYKEVINFLEYYSCYFVYEKRVGVYWNPNPTITEVPSVTKIETKTIHQCKVSPIKTTSDDKRQDNKNTQDEQPYSKIVERHDLSENNWLEISFILDICGTIDWHRVRIIRHFSNTQSVIPLTGNAAAILKFLIDHENEIIKAPDWPFWVSHRTKVYWKIKDFLGEYRELIVLRRGIGVMYSRTFLFNE